ncbi:beta-lactamase/transpeptidase-like protein [Penicillium desertorum]|uniref:Beta-lactamase/transpeptidase-like protein n=1 Tax=Penicillium desertorum TaxID=1303715 RepID=A0A9W9WJM6_9EURO|nr:beta-lactamase/transpeptidase-like protein [Penicillium desertorum]
MSIKNIFLLLVGLVKAQTFLTSTLTNSRTPLPTSATSAEAPSYVDPAQIGTFNLSTVNNTNPADFAFLTRHEDELLPNRTTQIRHGSKLRRLHPGTPIEFSAAINGSIQDIDSFMYECGIAGLMIVKDGAIRLEKYQYGNMPSSLNVVQSVTKSFLTTAIGIAIKRKIFTLNAPVSEYVPELAGTPYGPVLLQNLADMTAGVEPPNGTDIPDLFTDIYTRTDPEAVLDFFKTYQKVAEPGEAFSYHDENYYVLALSLTRAVKVPLEDWVTEHIWEPSGMEYDGYMRTTGAHQVDGHGGLAITLQDMARFGLFVLESFHGKTGPDVPKRWFDNIADATTSTGVRAPGNNENVPDAGYQTGWWTMPRGEETYRLGDDRAFAAMGTYDQAIYIIPNINAVIAMQSSYPVHYPDLFCYGQEFATAAALALKK